MQPERIQLEKYIEKNIISSIDLRSKLFVCHGQPEKNDLVHPEIMAYYLTYWSQSRCVSIFDDALSMFQAQRFPSSAILARAFLETLGFLALIRSTTLKTLASDEGKFCSEIFALANSSDIKRRIQKEGPRDESYYTKEAKSRFGKVRSKVVRATQDAIGALEDLVVERWGALAKTTLWDTYTALSEHSHPSQSSIMYCYGDPNALVDTSDGPISHRTHLQYLVSFSLIHIIFVSELTSDVVGAIERNLLNKGITFKPKFGSPQSDPNSLA